ncbi:MAG TPA: CapA family protein [Spirochaetia bacterium]|nr:CapA family protein [Spirochaetales bacterium]HRY73011.1 CapA family protein [Spirochaetia bacterium]
MTRLKVFLAGLLARMVGLAMGERWRRSLGHEDDVRHMGLEEKLFWLYKSMVRQVELAEPGSGLEERFAAQDLDFTPPDSFVKEASVVVSAGGDLSAMELIRPDNTERLWDEVGGFLFGGAATDGAAAAAAPAAVPVIAVANLETPIRPGKPSVGVPAVCLAAPALNGSAAMFDRFQSGGGFAYLATANNHSYDQGEDGVAETLDFLDARGVPHSGTARSPEERDAFPVLERGGVRVAFLSWTYCLNGRLLPEGKEHLANVARLNKAGFDAAPIAAQARAARERGADFVVAVLHWSVEFEAYPTKAVAEAARRVAEAGVDVVLGGHPHNAQPSERLSVRDPATGLEREALVVYSLGELVALNLHTKNSRLAQLVRVELSVGTEGGRRASRITRFEILPIATSYRRSPRGAGTGGGAATAGGAAPGGPGDEYRVLDLRAALEALDRGENPEGWSRREIRELKRLGALAARTMLPADAGRVLAPAGAWRKA